jgi:hypothetical protein
MTTVKIFLASSSELRADRDQFEILINRKNKHWHDRGVFLYLERWEDFVDALSKTRLQDEYNRTIKECDIFVVLFFTKVGPYTAEEFETAFGHFKATNKPVIYTYFKDAEITTGAASRIKDDLQTLWAFQERLAALEHFQTVYENTDKLLFHFYEQLDKLAEKGTIKLADGQKNGKWERIDRLRSAVVQLQDYCKVEISEALGADVGPGRDMLPKDGPRSPLEHAQNLDQIFGATKFLLSPETRSEMEALIGQVQKAAQLEFRRVANPELGISMLDKYDAIFDKTESCIEMLSRDAE